jgi:hypothetical protein
MARVFQEGKEWKEMAKDNEERPFSFSSPLSAQASDTLPRYSVLRGQRAHMRM